MTDLVSLTELRLLTRQRADQENSQFVNDTELTRYLNNSWGELYSLINENFNEDYFTTTSTVSMVSGTDTYDLPSDFYKMRGVDLVVTSTESVPLFTTYHLPRDCFPRIPLQSPEGHQPCGPQVPMSL